jgi:branched-chain amino acid transport system substrate-binding protein
MIVHARCRPAHWLAVAWILTIAGSLSAQTNSSPPQPYAAIDREAIDYAGPGRDAGHDLPGNEIKIGLILPLTGARKAEGDALLAAAQMALEDEALTPFSNGLRLTLSTRDESGLWGRASSEIVNLVVDDRALALITSPDGRAAHLAEQVGNRLGVPVLTLSSDSTTTQINIPWFFRVVPDDVAQAQLFAQDIYRQRDLHKVLLITEDDHDGRVGREEFEKAARRLNAPSPARIKVPVPLRERDSILGEIGAHQPQVIVLWTGAEATARLLTEIRQHAWPVHLYVCRKALHEPFMQIARQPGSERIWFATSRAGDTAHSSKDFEERYRSRAGIAPSPAVLEMYDAVRLVAAALRESGPNRARLRDSLAKAHEFPGVSGAISFDGAGNNQAAVTLIPLQ